MNRIKKQFERRLTIVALALFCLTYAYADNFVIGDVNGDGKVDKNDISKLVSYILGDTPDSFNNEVADVNGDEAINIADVAAIIDLMQNSVADETKNLVTIFYDGSTATVSVASNVAQYVTPTVEGAHVSISQSNTDAVDGDEITYQLSGSTTDGEFSLTGAYKCTIALAGLTLTNTDGAAINISNSKRIQLSAKKDTENTLTDGADGSQKACIYSKGQLQLQGNGTLNVVGNTKHGIKSASYISVKNLTLNITGAVGDGISCEEYMLMKSGTLTISGTGDDGIQCDLGSSYSGATTDHEDEDTGNIYIEGGLLTVNVSAAAAKGVKSEGDLIVSGGTVSATTTGGGAWDEDELDTRGSCGLSADRDMTISGGTLILKSSGAGGKCLKCDSTLTVSGEADITGTATGTKYTYIYNGTTYSSSPKAIKAGTKTVAEGENTSRAYFPGGGGNPPGGGGGGNPPGGGGQGGPGQQDQVEYDYAGGIVITGGTIFAKSANHEAIESKSTIDILGGYVYAESSDDAINSASDFTVSGGYVMGNSSGNDGLDANGDFFINGGSVFAVATTSPEVGIDANTEGGKKLYISGGNVVAIGGLESGSSLTGVTSKSASFSKGSWYVLYSGSTKVLQFKVPSNSRQATNATISTAGTPSVKSDSSLSGTTFWNGYGITF